LSAFWEYASGKYVSLNTRVWSHLPANLRSSSAGSVYGGHLHRLIQLRSARRQYVGTFFFRNRPELALLIRLLRQWPDGSAPSMTVLGCSKGAEVYSFSYGIRCARPSLNLRLCAVDIEEDVLRFAEQGIYELEDADTAGHASKEYGAIAVATARDQNRWIFERMSASEMEGMFDQERNQVRVKARFRKGIEWRAGDAGATSLAKVLGLQDIVVANRFLCHMRPNDAERCLRNFAGLVRPGGYLFVSGVDLDVRSKVARDLGWQPITDLIHEIHEGDPSLRRDWPLQYWALEPFNSRHRDWQVRYASVFQLGSRPVPVAEKLQEQGHNF
jgi:chemotaxis methyl-accepting protein methylase